ncbi:hypothetical protein CsatB_021657 [Cannabis sativa]
MPNSYSSSHDQHLQTNNLLSTKKDCEIENTKAEMGEVREENKRLKTVLNHMEKDYKSLQLRFFDIVKEVDHHHDHDQDQDLKKPITIITNCDDEIEEADQLVSLRLGRSPKNITKTNLLIRKSRDDEDQDQDHQEELIKANLTLGLGSNNDNDQLKQLSSEIVINEATPDNSSELLLEANNNNKIPNSINNNNNKMIKSSTCTSSSNNDQDEVVSQAQVKRARVSVRARCDTPTMNDGCQWRKYGQKIAKGNPCPRAYYRCTVAPSCPVRKQVQRCADDMSILITTYEGSHNHPLPVTATAMASTTSAAASMLLSGSSTSSSNHHDHPFFTPNKNSSPLNMINGLVQNNNNFNYFDHTLRTKQFYSSTSLSPLFPTITLDLTTPQLTSSTTSAFASSSNSRSSSLHSFGPTSEPKQPPLWGNNVGYLNYGPMYYDKAHQTNNGPLNLGGNKQAQEFIYQRCAEKIVSYNNNNHNQGSSAHETLTETLTKAITSDPSTFKSVIAAAISSMVGGGETHLGRKQDGVEKLSQRLTLGDVSTNTNSNITSTTATTANTNNNTSKAVSHNPLTLQNGQGLSSSYFNRLSSSNF